MSFPRYPEYKDSGVEWPESIPSHWETKRFKQLVRSIEQGWSPQCESAPADPETEWGVLKVGCVNGGRFDPRENKLLPAALNPVSDLSLKGGDLLVSRANTPELVGSAALVDRDYPRLLLCDKLYRLRVLPTVALTQFLCRFLGSAHSRSSIEKLASGASSSMLNISQSAILDLSISMPALEEQRSIVEFLERETAKIDALVAEQERLIDLLKEKRQAVISHAVTKGLNPNAPMKDSGIEWLGKIPTHWAVMQSRRMFRVRSEQALPGDKQLTASQKYGVLFQADFVELEGRRVVEVIKGLESLLHVEPNDFIISMRSFQGGIEWCGLRGSTSFHYVILVPVKGVHPPFFAQLLKSSAYIQALRTTTDLIRDGQELRYSNFVQVWLPVVPLEEQAAIARYLQDTLASMDRLVAESERGIALLRERRAALISAAVTGQIDVRSESQRTAA